MATILAATPAGAVTPKVGERDRQQPAVDDAADQVAEKNPTPVGEHRLCVGFILKPRERQQAKTAGDEIEAEQHDEDEADGEDQRADERLVGLHRARDGETCGGAEDAPGKAAADDQVERRQSELAAPGIDHGRSKIRRLHVVHLSAPVFSRPAETPYAKPSADQGSPHAAEQQMACQFQSFDLQ